ncbi:hypothetical protein BURMUCGD2M_6664 [Burkholderia multivorans CGD2M]|uniref:Uncharacterized protein n=1 Tax=Burkholderia multivorans CGD2 TaxID=513052 RepID=B9BPQ0_9BURK|nr:hypothetical protein BURMUCGD2_6671 [Burkholderia multivorans CGD2]EEE13942.1 hypothetical protein BURMUCGD2M_6664 [Burkholderia multivorans CGD2M]
MPDDRAHPLAAGARAANPLARGARAASARRPWSGVPT